MQTGLADAMGIFFLQWSAWICGGNYGCREHWDRADSRWDWVCDFSGKMPVYCLQTL